MFFITEQFGALPGWFFATMVVFLRYAFAAGLAFLCCYVVWKNCFLPYKIQKRHPRSGRILAEIRHSAGTASIFAFIGLVLHLLRQAGHTRIYTDIEAYGWGYFLLSVMGLIFAHDTYFYWTHRLMHHPRLFPIFHAIHHRSRNPTPWASLAFHPLEAIVEFGIVPVAVFFLPVHPLALVLFATWSLAWNIMGHLGFEFFPRNFLRHPILRWFNTSTHHNMHHHHSGCNYGIYFNFWDTWMGTNHAAYRKRFEER